MPELDTQNLGTLVASATNAKKYKVYLVDSSAGVTAEKLQQNPNYAGAGVLVSSEAADVGGSANVDLAPLKADLERKLGGLGAGAQVASFVVGIGADASEVKAVAGPTFTVKGAAKVEGELNDYILRLLPTYPQRAGYNWTADAQYGVSRNLFYQGKQIAWSKGADKTYCCGITFEVFMRAYESFCTEKGAAFKIGSLDWNGLEKLRKAWYVPTLQDKGAVRGIGEAGIGREVSAAEAKPGDIGQWWEGNAGHSLIFMGWVEGHSRFKYWSTQPITHGIAEVSANISSHGHLYIGRVKTTT